MALAAWILTALLVLAAPAFADSIELVNGDSLRGTIVESDDETIVFDHPVLGRLEIARDQIADAVAPAAADTAQTKPSDDGEPAAKSGLFGTGFLAGWTRNLALGMSGSEGKSRESSFNSRLTADYEDESDRWRFDTGFFFSSTDGKAETNEFYSQLEKDWLFGESKWFVFVDGRYDHDQFRDWDHRIAGSTGVGYEFLRTEPWDLLGRVGMGANQTIGGAEALSPEAVTGFEAEWRIADGQTLRATTLFYPDLSELGEFRTLSSFDWILAISQKYDLSLKLGLRNEYESVAVGEKNDFKYVGSLVYGF